MAPKNSKRPAPEPEAMEVADIDTSGNEPKDGTLPENLARARAKHLLKQETATLNVFKSRNTLTIRKVMNTTNRYSSVVQSFTHSFMKPFILLQTSIVSSPSFQSVHYPNSPFSPFSCSSKRSVTLKRTSQHLLSSFCKTYIA